MTRMMIGVDESGKPFIDANASPDACAGVHPYSSWCDVFPNCERVFWHSDASPCYGDPNCVRWHTDNYDHVRKPPMPQPDPSKPNHYHHDVLGDPATCKGDHNHPEPTPPPGPAGVSQKCNCSMRSDHTLGCASGLAVGVQLDPATLKSPRASALDEARRLVTGDRNNQYGPPTQDFQRTADLLNALGYQRVDATDEIHDIQPSDVAIIIAQVKVSRIMHSRGKRDSWVDLAGYAACGYECATEEENGHA